ncbi:MAG: adenosine kinase [Porticoccaceae bacterium]|nr:adenosine kinase [Pseudomonadales bacterium]MCP5172809.1 adenosine kinase [Pseudomonadales bacterium]MCP5302283.1 adenosine kinase [Pseudomonadales bacterium]
MTQYHVYGIGAALVDTEIEVADQDLAQLGIEKGLMTLVDEARQHELVTHLRDHLVASRRACGGSAANTIIALSYFGGKAFYSCKVADDDNGRFYLQDMESAGVKHPHTTSPGKGVTGKCLVMITPDAERTMNTFLGTSETVSENEIDAEAIACSEYLYMEGYLVTSPSGRAAAIKARKIAQASKVKVAISLSDPGMVTHFKTGLQEMIGDRVDLLFCNRAEALEWTGASQVLEAAEKLKNVSHRFAITLGAEGSLIFDGDNLHRVAGHPVTAIDTNGAGDMFAGALLYGLTHGLDCTDAGKLANLASAKVVSQFGPRLHPEQHQELLLAFKNLPGSC